MSKELRYYRISGPALRELLMAAHSYWALEGGGVDNWEWCGQSIQDYIDECSAIDFVHYEDMEEIVESSLCNYEQCNCKINTNPFQMMLEGLGIE